MTEATAPPGEALEAYATAGLSPPPLLEVPPAAERLDQMDAGDHVEVDGLRQ